MIMERKGLIAFDFDNTIIDANSDQVVVDMIDGEVPKKAKLLFDEDNWTDYMGAIFEHLHSTGTKKKDLDSKLAALPFVDGLPSLLEWLNKNDFEVIVISDSNSYFINHILQTHKLSPFVMKVFTNPAFFDDDQLLKIQWYHSQDWCNLSNKNMCKGQILEEYIATRKNENVVFRHHYYCGDGSNDFCPSLRLKEGDVTFPRIGYSLQKKLAASEAVAATIFPWATGAQIQTFIAEHAGLLLTI